MTSSTDPLNQSARGASATVGSTADFPPYGSPIALELARIIALGALAEARRLGWRMAVAVAEPSGELILLEKDDDTQYGSSRLAVQKAQAAARYRRRTKVFEDLLTQGTLSMLSAEGAIALDGGIPIVVSGFLVGGVGVSGELASQDAQVALAGLEALATSLQQQQT